MAKIVTIWYILKVPSAPLFELISEEIPVANIVDNVEPSVPPEEFMNF